MEDCGDDIEYLLAADLVGDRARVATMYVCRQLSKRWRDAIDSRVHRWCLHFSEVQQRWIGLGGNKAIANCSERAVEAMVQLEALCERAFGENSVAVCTLPQISNMDPVSYHAATKTTCVLCKSKMNHPHPAERPCPPCFTFSHSYCEKKHLFAFPSKSTKSINGVRSAGSSEIHNEVYSVCSYKGIEMSHSDVMDRMPAWYTSQNWAESCVFVVWARPHPRVRRCHTLYDVLGVTEDDLQQAALAEEEQKRRFRDAMEMRRMAVESKAAELASVSEGEIRVWLGKGKTRWRSIEDIAAFHKDCIASFQIDQLTSASMRKIGATKSVSVVCNSVYLFDATLDALARRPSEALLEWIVNALTLHGVFGHPSYEMQFVDASMVDVAISNEAKVYATIFGLVEDMSVSSVVSCKARTIRRSRSLSLGETEPYFAITTRCLVGKYPSQPQFVMSRSDVCKLKFRIMRQLPEQMHCLLPAVPPLQDEADDIVEEVVSTFVKALFSVCMSSGAAKARATALYYMLPLPMVRELKTSVSFEASGTTVFEVGSQDSE